MLEVVMNADASATVAARRLRTNGSRLLSALAIAALLHACGAETDRATDQPAPALGPTKLADTNPDPDVVEVQLVASVGTTRYLPDGDATIWGYRDGSVPRSMASVPGPSLDLKQGQSVVVHFRNELPKATTIHWHGLRVPNTSDGTPSVQHQVEPGDSFDYEFVAQDAGTFWYHPHLDSDVQIERGLQGPIIVRGGADIAVDADRMFVLDDVKLEANGKLSTDTVPLDVMLGRQGNVLLANGIEGGRIVARSGARERWRFVDSANGRYFNLRLRGHSFKVISWDGGLIPEPYDVDTLLIAPGERYEVLVDLPDAAGKELTLETLHYDRGHDMPDPGPLPLFKIAIQGSAKKMPALPVSWGMPVDLQVPSDAAVRMLELTEEQTPGVQFPQFFINGAAYPDVPPMEAKPGDVEIWRVYNNSEMDHPFHVHGMFFRVLSVDDIAPSNDGWKDTINIPQKKVLRFAVQYGDPGTWMFHCHILEHAERGMMGELHLAR